MRQKIKHCLIYFLILIRVQHICNLEDPEKPSIGNTCIGVQWLRFRVPKLNASERLEICYLNANLQVQV